MKYQKEIQAGPCVRPGRHPLTDDGTTISGSNKSCRSGPIDTTPSIGRSALPYRCWVSVAGHVNHDRAGQDQNVIFPLGDIHP